MRRSPSSTGWAAPLSPRPSARCAPLLADRGFAVPDRPGLRLRTLADVFAYAAAEDVRLRIDGTETLVRRPKAHRPGRCAFVPGKKEQVVAVSGSGTVGGCRAALSRGFTPCVWLRQVPSPRNVTVSCGSGLLEVRPHPKGNGAAR
jgi:hypothetical protein